MIENQWIELLPGPDVSFCVPQENKLISAYNEKPFLTRPQHTFFSGPNYFEIDFDIHSYAFIARKGFDSMFSRLRNVVFDAAFLLQGNRPEELPEFLLSCVRVHRIDFTQMRYMSNFAETQSLNCDQELEIGQSLAE